jgi:undecaprenyl phosphate-alpha-L-ara4FN deformylase
MKKIGLRIDVDTYRGTRYGVPALCSLLEDYKIRGTFYFTVGPDNMGRHLWRLLKPAFLWKMLRTNAAGLYGPEIIFMGTCWPGPNISKRLGGIIKACADSGHEVGMHAWDHHWWQARIDTAGAPEVADMLKRGMDALTELLGRCPDTSAVPGWKCTDTVLFEKASYDLKYNSDCRGDFIFYPVVNGKALTQLQIPVTMPTYDEVLGRDGINNDNYNDFMLEQLNPDGLNVLTIHAEAEGGKCLKMFDDYLNRAGTMGYEFVPLRELIEPGKDYPKAAIFEKPFPGREGTLAQAEII